MDGKKVGDRRQGFTPSSCLGEVVALSSVLYMTENDLVVNSPAVVVTGIADGDFLGRDGELFILLSLVLVVVGFSIFHHVALLEVEVLHFAALAVRPRDGAAFAHVGVAHPLEQVGVAVVV